MCKKISFAYRSHEDTAAAPFKWKATRQGLAVSWPSSKALGWQAEGPHFESTLALLFLQRLWSVDTVL